ncbi:MAG TPA: hypothetical protein VKA46_38570 [Gemmataceae bacterium]|nr:hypothetical protein [Gemmataceae bacterium]
MKPGVCPTGLVLLVAVSLGCGGGQTSHDPSSQENPSSTASSSAKVGDDKPTSAQTGSDAQKKPGPPPEAATAPYDSATRGALQVKGDATGDWFVVYQDGKRVALPGLSVPPTLNTVVELVPGTYEVLVNKTKRMVTIRAGEKAVLLTGTLVVEGEGNWYTPYQGDEAKLARGQPKMNSAIALFPGTYTVWVRVRLDQSEKLTDSAQVLPGEKTVLKR